MSTILGGLEAQLGDNLNVLRDALDLQIRQGDTTIINAMQDLDKAWGTLAVLLATEKLAKKQRLHFNAVQDGGSVVDTLFHYASEMFPNSLAVKARNNELTAK